MTDAPRVFSETEAAAIIADRVAKETAALTTTVETLKTEKADLATKLDVAEVAKVAAEKAAADKAAEFEAFKADLATKAEMATKKDERIKVLKEAAALTDEWFAAEGRIDRIVAKSDEDFADYVDAIKTVAVKTDDKKTEEKSEGAPRETAMQGSEVKTEAPSLKDAALGFFIPSYTPEGGK